MTKIEELRATHQYFEYLWLCRDAGDTYSIGSGDDIIATSTSESLARFTVFAHNALPALLEAAEALAKCEAVLAQMQDSINDPVMLQNIIRQGYYGHATLRSRAALSKLEN